MAERGNGAVAWAEAPDPDRRPFYPIYTPTTDRDVNLVILSPDVLGVFVHYYNRRTRPCLGSPKTCEGCDLRHDRRWKGYLAGWDKARGRLALAEVTQEAFLRCPGFHTLKGQLRGMVLKMQRAGASRNARVSAQLFRYAGPEVTLPPAFDVKSALERVWFTEARDHERVGRDASGMVDAGQNPAQAELFEQRKDGPYA